jgi:hypothetical protein
MGVSQIIRFVILVYQLWCYQIYLGLFINKT